MWHSLNIFIPKNLLLFILFSLLPNNVYAQTSITRMLKFGADFLGKHEISGLGLSGSEDVETGISPGFEMYFNVKSDNAQLAGGFGIEYQVQRRQVKHDGNFNFIPIYALGKIFITPTSDNSIGSFATIKIGYSLFRGDNKYKGNLILDDGLYLGIGLGIVYYEKIQIEALYSKNTGKAHVEDIDFEVEYTNLKLSFGILF